MVIQVGISFDLPLVGGVFTTSHFASRGTEQGLEAIEAILARMAIAAERVDPTCFLVEGMKPPEPGTAEITDDEQPVTGLERVPFIAVGAVNRPV